MCPSVGSPFHISVIDPSKATARGDGLDMVQCNQMTSFLVSAPAAQLKDFDIKIIGNSFSIADTGDGLIIVIIKPTLRRKSKPLAIPTFALN